MGRFSNLCLGLCVLLLIGSADAATIDSVKVEGNYRSDTSLILATSGLSPGRELTPVAVQQTIRRLYKLSIFSDVAVLRQPSDRPNRDVVVIRVREFPTLDRVYMDGFDKIDEDDLLTEIRFASGQVVSPRAILRGRQSMLRKYRDEGYHMAEVDWDTTASEVPGKIDLVYRITEGQKVQVDRIRFHGNFALTDADLQKVMETKEDRWWRSADYDEDLYFDDKEMVLSLYRRHGYRDASVAADTVYLGESGEDLYIDITVDEGQEYQFGQIEWDGNDLVPDREIHALVTLSEGNVYDEEAITESRVNIYNAYQERGYLGANIQPFETIRKDTIDIDISIVEGQPSRIRLIEIVGNTKTKEKVIRRELVMRPGDVFRRSAMERSFRNIFFLNYFEEVAPDVKPLPDGDVDLIWSVTEKHTGRATLAVGYGQEDKLVGQIGLGIPNLFGNGQAVDFNWEFGRTTNNFYLSFSEPWIFDTPTSGSITLFSTRRNLDVDESNEGFSVRVGRRLRFPDDYSRVVASYRFAQSDYSFPSNWTDADKRRFVSEPDDLPFITSSLGLGYIRDARNLPMFPTAGSYFSYNITVAGGPMGGDVRYNRHEAKAEFYLPLLKVKTWEPALGLKTSFGHINAPDRFDVPLGERFRPGGISWDGQIRGYVDWGIGPKDEQGRLIGGFTQLITTAEISIPVVPQQIYGVLFADAGNAWLSIPEMDPYNMYRSLGFGIRIQSGLVGVIGFDFAYGFDRPNIEGGARWETHFQFGPTLGIR